MEINELEKKIGRTANEVGSKSWVYDQAAKKFSEEGNNEKAKECLLEAAKNYVVEAEKERSPSDAANYYFAGRNYLDVDSYEKAKECFLEAKKRCNSVISSWNYCVSNIADYAAWNSPSALFSAHEYRSWAEKGLRRLFVKKTAKKLKSLLFKDLTSRV